MGTTTIPEERRYLGKDKLKTVLTKVKEKLAESEKVFASIDKEISELNNQISEINNNKNSLADNNKKHEQMRIEAEARIDELESHSQENKDKLAEALKPLFA